MRFHHRIGIESVSLKAELFLLFLEETIIGFLISFVISAVSSAARYGDIVFAAAILFLLFLLFLWRRFPTKIAQEGFFLLYCIGMGNVLLPLLYFFCGGLESGMPLFYILFDVATAFLLDNLALALEFGTSTAELVLVLIYDYRHPGLLARFTDLGAIRYFDIPVVFIIVGVSVGLALRVIMRNFRENQKMNQELLRQIRGMAQTDPLTGTYDRGYLFDHIGECIAQYEKDGGKTFSLIMFDLDYFKKINDTYGHLTGDQCLKKLVQVVRENLRKDDIIARYGGEEFICVLPGADDITAFRRAEKIREIVEKTPLSPELKKPVTISAGVAQYEAGMATEQLLKAVDSNLYLAKRRGRNRVIWRNGNFAPMTLQQEPPVGDHRRAGDISDEKK